MANPLLRLASALLPAALLLAACARQDDAPAEAASLWDRIHAAPGFSTWRRAPGYATRRPSFTAHSRAVDIYVNDVVSAALATPPPGPTRRLPDGSIIVKEGFGGSGDRALVAVMEKREGEWFWAEYDDAGEPLFSGRPSVCLDCHRAREGYSDWVFAFELAR